MPMNRREFLRLTGFGLGGTLALPNKVLSPSKVDNAGHHVAMLYDSTKCIGCHACSNACRDWNKTTPELDASGLYDAPRDVSADTWTLIKLFQGEGEHAFVKRQCMHCVHPACVSACPVAALKKLDTGPVVYDAKRCIGCRYCMVACPFGIPCFEWDETVPFIAKCTFCHDRLVTGQGPNCAEWCPTGALIWGRRDELVAEAQSRLATSPNRYMNHIYGKDDVGGTSVLYLSSVPFEKLGLPDLGSEPMPELSDKVVAAATPIMLLVVAGLMSGVYWATKRRAER
jgi:formate dehydrogenase iron-sulfur subunit